MIRTATALLILYLFGAAAVHAQVRVDKPLQLIGAALEDRQVTGLTDTLAPEAAINARTAQAGAFRHIAPVNGTTWEASAPAITSVGPGAHVIVFAPAPTTGSVNLTLNGSGPWPVLNAGLPLDGAALHEGGAIALVFDGASFQVLNGAVEAQRGCPVGTVAASEQLCIEAGERAPTDFFQAAITCTSSGLRLCSWGEFVSACIRSGELGLTNMSNNWEWSNNSSNEDGSVRVVGSNSCNAAGNGLATSLRAFRCCVSR